MIRGRTSFAALALAGALLLFPAVTLAATRADLDAARQRAEQAREAAKAEDARADALLAETKRIEGDIDRLSAEVGGLQSQIAKVSARRQVLEREVARLRHDIELKRVEIAATEAELAQQRSLLSERVCAAYKQGDDFYLQLILGAHDWSDLVTRASLIQAIMQEDDRIIDDLDERQADLEVARESLDRDLQAVGIKRAAVSAEENALRRLRSQRTSKMREQEAAQQQKEDLLDESRANAEKLRQIAEAEERESARIAEELRRQSSTGSGVYGGIMAWPVPSSTRITSPFGWRVHPILGTRRFHAGIDIGASSGAQIVAAGSGKVIYTGYHGGYGNTVMIDHSDGLVTLYAHQSSIRCSTGQEVSKGDLIGLVGSTGMSTGPHLHFETRVNGSPVDPMKYLK